MRGGVSHFAGADAAGRDGVLRERRESLFARRLFRVLRHGVLCRACLSCGLYGHHGACVPESQPRTDLSAHRLSGGGDDHPDRAAAAARDMAVRHAAFGAVFHLLQRDVEPARRADRPFESEQLSQSHGGDAPQRRGARRLRCGQFQAGQRPIWPRERRHLPCRDCRVHQARLCAPRLLLPNGRRRILCAAARRRQGARLCAGLCAPAERASQGTRLPADGVVRLGRDFKRERRHGQGPRRPQHVPLQKRAQSPPHVRGRGRGVIERRPPHGTDGMEHAGRKHLRRARTVRRTFVGHAAGIRDGQRHV